MRNGQLDLPVEPVESADAAGLRYVNDDRPGFQRRATGRGFAYVNTEGKTIHDPKVLTRIKALAIPPAWTNVWICPVPEGHLQATGRDARRRKQHRYHPRWREVREETKYMRMLAFARALPGIRRRVAQDLKLPGLPRNKVLATVVKLLELSLIRVGNEEYARENKSFGLTTLRNRHVEVNGAKVRFEFRGKSGREHEIEIKNERLARIVKSCQDLPGQELFQYLDSEGQLQRIDSEDVNQYLREISGADFTAKDFRTWSGTVLAAVALEKCEPCQSKAQAKRNLTGAIEMVAERLGNTPSVCRKCYVHPALVDCYLEGTLTLGLPQARTNQKTHTKSGLEPEEAAVLALLRKRLAKDARSQDLGKALAASLKARRKSA
jgi:DNA topoisomerase-1